MSKDNGFNFEVDIKEWTMGDVEDFQIAATGGDFPGLREGFARAVKSWSLDLDPTDPVSYRQLKPGQWKAISGALNKQVLAFFQD